MMMRVMWAYLVQFKFVCHGFIKRYMPRKRGELWAKKMLNATGYVQDSNLRQSNAGTPLKGINERDSKSKHLGLHPFSCSKA